MEEYLSEITLDPDLKQRNFHKLRKRLLETALPFYLKLAEQKGDNPKLEEARGRAHFRLACLRLELGANTPKPSLL